jgi:hypothetical protein
VPLDSTRKANHIQSVITRTFAGRQKTVVLVTLSSGTYSYTAVSVIMRPQEVIDPQIPDVGGGQPRPRADMLMIAPLGTSFTGVVFVADTTTATAAAVQAAPKYEIIEAVTAGIVPGGTHVQVLLRRLR